MGEQLDMFAARQGSGRGPTRPPELRLFDDEIIVDSFAGGGGASTGIEWATGRSPDIAVNHDPEAIAMHAVNHPKTRHLTCDVFDVDPEKVCAGKRVALAWFSPDCTFHSKARGGKPFRDRKKARRRRGLAGVVIRWARSPAKPRVICVENVEEFQDWGPLLEDGKPCPVRRGLSFRRWVSSLKSAGYQVDWRELRACDYGAPTIRKRLFVVARCDGQPIVWPEPTHGRGREPFRTAADCIDWSLPCPSIFERKKDLAEKTLRRIARGVQRYVIESASPFIVPVTHGGDARVHSIEEPLRTITGAHRGEHALVSAAFMSTQHGMSVGAAASEPLRTATAVNHHALVAAALTKYHGGERGERRGQAVEEPFRTLDTSNRFGLVGATLIQTGYGERPGQAPRVPGLDKPLGTVMGGGCKHALVTAFLAKHYSGVVGSKLPEPLGTVTAVDHYSLVAANLVLFHGTRADGQVVEKPLPTVRAGGTHIAEVRAFLTRYNGTSADGRSLKLPIGTVTTKDRFGVVTVHGEDYAIADIGLRMLAPRELFRAQGFPDSYVIDPVVDGKPLTKEAQVRMCGNSVSPELARALVAANVGASSARRVA